MSIPTLKTKIFQAYEQSIAIWNDCIPERCGADPCQNNAIDNFHSSDSRLYHYTTTETVLDILKNGRLWLSNSKFLNDFTELSFTKDMIEKVIEDSDFEKCRTIVKEEIETIGNLDRVFILSLSSNKDSLPLWYNYAKAEGCNFSLNERGFIGLAKGRQSRCRDHAFLFSLEADEVTRISRRLPSVNSYPNKVPWYNEFGKVIYCPRKQEEIIRGILTTFINLDNDSNYDTEKGAIRCGLNNKLLRCFLLFKHPAFACEEEYRFVVILHPSWLDYKYSDDKPLIKYRSSNGLFIPFIELNLKSIPGIGFAESVCVGPRNKIEVARDSISYYMKRNGYTSSEVKTSEVPLRY